MSVKRTGPGIRKAVQDIVQDAQQTVHKAALACEKVAKQAAPVDTGNLRNSITYKPEGPGRASVSTNVEYAPAQEYGTRKAPGRFYFRAGFEAGRKVIRDGVR